MLANMRPSDCIQGAGPGGVEVLGWGRCFDWPSYAQSVKCLLLVCLLAQQSSLSRSEVFSPRAIPETVRSRYMFDVHVLRVSEPTAKCGVCNECAVQNVRVLSTRHNVTKYIPCLWHLDSSIRPLASRDFCESLWAPGMP